MKEKGSGPENNPNSVPLPSVTREKSCDIKLSFLPCTSGQHVVSAFLELLPGDGPFHPNQIDPQRIQPPHHCQILSGGVVSVPRARLSPPCFNRTNVDSSREFPQLSSDDEYRQSRFCSRAISNERVLHK